MTLGRPLRRCAGSGHNKAVAAAVWRKDLRFIRGFIRVFGKCYHYRCRSRKEQAGCDNMQPLEAAGRHPALFVSWHKRKNASPDRVVAEWTLRMGGSVILEGERRPIADLAGLPAADFRIHTLNLIGVTLGAYGLRDELRRLPRLPLLKELYLNGRLWYDRVARRP